MAFRHLLLITLSFIVVLSEVTGSSNKKNVVCYLASWANYRTEGDGKGKYVVEDIDPYLCTHAIYAFAKLEDNKITVFDPYLDLEENWGLGGYKRFNSLRQKNTHLKTLISIGGWNEGSVKYSEMVSSSANRSTFVESVVKFLDKYGFNGLDVDWEYPANRGGKEEDKENFVLLLKELKDVLEPKDYLLTAAVAAGKAIIDSAYDVPQVAKYLDLINVMAYDFHGAWEQRTGVNAPLYANKSASVEQKEFTVDYAIKYWIDNGAPTEKLIMGFSFYGRTFTLEDQSKTGLGAPTIGKGGKAGIYTGQCGTLGFNEICLHLTKDAWTEEWDDTSKTPYAYKSDQWATYDDKRSVEVKLGSMPKASQAVGLAWRVVTWFICNHRHVVVDECGSGITSLKVDYLKKNGLAGALIWSLDIDDFTGTCYGEKNYLLTILTDRLWR